MMIGTNVQVVGGKIEIIEELLEPAGSVKPFSRHIYADYLEAQAVQLDAAAKEVRELAKKLKETRI